MAIASTFNQQRKCLRCHMKPAFFAIESTCKCGLTILVDHFKLYLYYELTQLLLIYNSR